MKILGLISGTSHDGIDAVLVDFEALGSDLLAKVIKVSDRKYPVNLRNRILAALPPNQTDFAEMCELDTLIGQEFAALAGEFHDDGIDLVSSHGQTMFHWVDKGKALGTLQLGQPAWIARSSGAPVLADLRIADIVAGGQGAPIVPILDLLVLGGDKKVVGSLNLGGIANITVLEKDSIRIAYDTGPASALIDALVVRHSLDPAGFDSSGRIAARGQIHQQLLSRLLAEPYYGQPAPKSTGKELFHINYLDGILDDLGLDLAPQDLVATVTELTAITVANELNRQAVEKLVVGGGGVRNITLMRSIEEKTGLESIPFSSYGLAGDLKEALAMALIGWLSIHNLPATSPATTGAKTRSILGNLTAGPAGFPIPQGPTQLPKRLVVSGDN